jgi:hypothetical protein
VEIAEMLSDRRSITSVLPYDQERKIVCTLLGGLKSQ